MRIGLFGGSFNPIHNGHIALGTTMLSAMSLNEVWYLVSPQNPLKRHHSDLLDENLRLHLVSVALEDHPNLIASDFEFFLPRPSYTWDTLQNLHAAYPQHEFILIIGGDNLSNFHKWAHYQDLLHNYEIAVYPREDCEVPNWATTMPNIHIVQVPMVNISSTKIRQMIKKGEDISPFVPPKVAFEVEKNSFYG